MSELSKTKIDQLGDRIRQGSVDEADLRLLDEYRLSFGDSYERVVNTIRFRQKLAPTGRVKSTQSIKDKLRRQTIRLSQIQDVAGCRLVVPDIRRQEEILAEMRTTFESVRVDDHRDKPSHGYRAIHVIVHNPKAVEIQIRTSFQHLWAELSEKLSDLLDPDIKYGGGGEFRPVLDRTSALIARAETDDVFRSANEQLLKETLETLIRLFSRR